MTAMEALTTPKKLAGVVSLGVSSAGRHVFLNPFLPNWVHLSPDAASLYDRCDGRSSFEDLAGLVAGPDGADEPEARRLLARMLAAFQESGLLEGGGLGESPPDAPRPLNTVALYLTKACNLRCSYCFLDAGKPWPDELTTAEWVRLMDDLRHEGVEILQWLGGEPMLRKDLFELAAEARERGFNLNLLTNGTLVDEASARRVFELFHGVQVSLDGIREVNDFSRGQGSFDRITRGIRTLLDAGNSVVVSCVVTRRNIDSMEDFFACLAELGVRNLHFMNLQSCGRGRDAPTTGIPTFEFAYKLTELWKKWQDTFLIPIPKLLALPRFERKMNCSPGNGVLEIDPRGSVFPCYFFMEKGIAAGNIREQGIGDIYFNAPRLGALRSVTVDRREPCSSCEFRYLCGGGCMGEDRPSRAFCEDSKKFITWVIMELQDIMDQQVARQKQLKQGD